MFLNESRARCAERCLRSYYWRYLYGGHGLRPKWPDKKLTWGSLLHGGLAAHYQRQSVRDGILSTLYELFPSFDDMDYSFKNEWLAESEWIEKVIGRYAAWAASRDSFAIQGVEQSGAVVLGESCWQCGALYPEYPIGFTHSYEPGVVWEPSCPTCEAPAHHFVFRLDLLVRDQYGLKVIDHKSTSSGVDEHYLKSWEHSYQMWGYCYGAEKQSGLPVGSYAINIIRKVKAAGEEPDLTKSCPSCGRKKDHSGCATCDGTGRVTRAPKASDQPFHRETFSFGDKQREWWLRARTRIANKITEHSRRLAEGDPTAFPHNPTSFGCDQQLCHGQSPGQPLAEVFVDEEKYLRNGPDYVSLKRLAMEEGT